MEKQQKNIGFIIVGLLIVGAMGMGIWNWLNRGAENGNFQHVSPQDAHALIKQHNGNTDFVILDVRTPAEFSQGYIENAKNIDFYANTFRNQLDKLDKQKIYLVYCRSGNRSGKTLRMMEQSGFQQAYNMTGGIGQWSRQRLRLVR